MTRNLGFSRILHLSFLIFCSPPPKEQTVGEDGLVLTGVGRNKGKLRHSPATPVPGWGLGSAHPSYEGRDRDQVSIQGSVAQEMDQTVGSDSCFRRSDPDERERGTTRFRDTDVLLDHGLGAGPWEGKSLMLCFLLWGWVRQMSCSRSTTSW